MTMLTDYLKTAPVKLYRMADLTEVLTGQPLIFAKYAKRLDGKDNKKTVTRIQFPTEDNPTGLIICGDFQDDKKSAKSSDGSTDTTNRIGGIPSWQEYYPKVFDCRFGVATGIWSNSLGELYNCVVHRVVGTEVECSFYLPFDVITRELPVDTFEKAFQLQPEYLENKEIVA